MTALSEPPEFPPALDGDDDDVAWALQTAAVQWNRGGHADAIVWLRRAVDSALEVGAHQRAADLNRIAESIATYVEAGGREMRFSSPDLGDVLAVKMPSGAASSSASDVDALLAHQDLPSVELGGYEEASASLVDAVELQSRDEVNVVFEEPAVSDEVEEAEEVEEIEEIEEVELLDDDLVDDVEDEDVEDENQVSGGPVQAAAGAQLSEPAPASVPRIDRVSEPADTGYSSESEEGPTNIRKLPRELMETIDDAALGVEVAEPEVAEPEVAEPVEPVAVARPEEALVEAAPAEVLAETSAVETPAADEEGLDFDDDDEIEMTDDEVAVESDEEVVVPPSSVERPRTAPPHPPAPAPVAATATAAATAEEPTDEPSVGGVLLAEVRGLEDLPPESQVELARKARIEVLGSEEEIGSFGLALVLKGAVAVMPTIADVACAQAGPLEPIFAQGNLDQGVELRIVALPDGAEVAIWQADDFQSAIASCPWVADEFKNVGDRFQALAGATMGPLGDRLDDAMRAMITDRCEVKRLEAGEELLQAGKPLPGLFVVGAGKLETDGGEFMPGDILFAQQILGGGKVPNTVRASSEGALLLFVARMATHELMMSVPPLLELLATV